MKEKNIRGKFFILAIGFMIVIVLVFIYINVYCGSEKKSLDKETIKNIKREYPEWMETLDIPNDKIIGYEGICGYSDGPIQSNQIALNIDDSDGNYLKELVQKDNDFLKKYPGFFKNKEKRMIYYGYRQGNWPCAQSYGYKNYLESACENLNIDVTLNRNMKIGFVLENIKRGKPTLYNIEVLEIYRDKKSMSSTDGEGMSVNSSFLLEHKINDLRYIILLDFVEAAGKKLEEEIKSTYPDVKIYQVNTKDEEKQ